VVLPRGSR